MCWRKNGEGPSTFANFLEVFVNDEKFKLAKLNYLCGIKHNVFFGVRMPKRRMHVQASTFGGVTKELPENEGGEARNLGLGGNIKSKMLSHFVRGKCFLTHGDYLNSSKRANILGGFDQASQKKKRYKNNLMTSYCCHTNTNH
jgi:hypothetical protein